MYFRNYGLGNTWLKKSLKCLLLEDPSTSNMVRGTKHCLNLNGTTFIIFIAHCEGNSVGQSFS